MKKIYLSILTFAVAGVAGAQTLGNLDLENWTAGEPDSWTYYESQTGQYEPGTNNWLTGFGEGASTFEETTNPAGGAGSSARIETIQAQPGGTYEQQTGNSYIPGFLQQTGAYTDRPSEVTFDVLAEPAGSDSSLVQVLFYGNGGNVIGFAQKYYDSQQTQWTAETLPVSFTDPSDPDSVSIVTVSSNSNVNQTVGSTIYVDNFAFTVPTYAPNVSNVVASDISDNGDGSDLEVTFDVPSNEADIANYWLVATTPQVSPGLLQDPLTFFQTNGLQATPNGSNQTVNFTASDVYYFVSGSNLDNSPIVENEEMVVWVYVEGQNGASDVFNNSNNITLTSQTTGLISETKKEMLVYPNPAVNVVNFNVPNVEGTISINTITGQEVVSRTIGNDVETVNVNNLNNGVYIYTVRDNSGAVLKTNKLVINK